MLLEAVATSGNVGTRASVKGIGEHTVHWATETPGH